MKRCFLVSSCVVAIAMLAVLGVSSTAPAQDNVASGPDDKAVQRARETVKMLDNIFKQTIVLVTDKYVHDEDDFAAGSAAVLLFKNVSDAGDHKVRLLDATGDPIEADNSARDDFEKKGIAKLKSGGKGHEQIVTKAGKSYLRSMTPVPVVMQKCVMCHDHYADVKAGEPIGAISYTIPIE